jgi:hypothetical protein
MNRKPFFIAVGCVIFFLGCVIINGEHLRPKNKLACFEDLTAESQNNQLKTGYLVGRSSPGELSDTTREDCARTIQQYIDGESSGPSLTYIGKCLGLMHLGEQDFCEYIKYDNVSKLQELIMKI